MWKSFPDNGKAIQIIAIYKKPTIGPVFIDLKFTSPIICKLEDKLWG